MTVVREIESCPSTHVHLAGCENGARDAGPGGHPRDRDEQRQQDGAGRHVALPKASRAAKGGGEEGIGRWERRETA